MHSIEAKHSYGRPTTPPVHCYDSVHGGTRHVKSLAGVYEEGSYVTHGVYGEGCGIHFAQTRDGPPGLHLRGVTLSLSLVIWGGGDN